MPNVNHLRTVLVCDGKSDAALEHPFRWLLKHHGFSGTLDFQVVHPSAAESRKLEQRLLNAVENWTPGLLLIHRDAENQNYGARLLEIQTAIKNLDIANWIPVIPVKMLESWLLFDEKAIRLAAGNPRGTAKLNIPRKISQLETLQDPKKVLFEALRTASELSGRRLQKFIPDRHRHLVAEEITDFSPILKLPAFGEFSKTIKYLIASS